MADNTKVVDAKSGLVATMHIYGMVKSNQLALARLLAHAKGTSFEEERDTLVAESTLFQDALLEDVGFEPARG